MADINPKLGTPTDPGRLRKTGATMLRSIGDVARYQTIADNDTAFVTPGDMLAELRDDNPKLIEVLRAARERVDEVKDIATSSIADAWIRRGRGARLVPVRGQPRGLPAANGVSAACMPSPR